MWLVPPPTPAAAFAVGTTTAQIVWRKTTRPHVTIDVADGPTVEVPTVPGKAPGSVIIEGLTPDRSYKATVSGCGRDQELSFQTLPTFQGPELARVATINDLHLGSTRFGLSGRMTERPKPEVPNSYRAAKAAVDEAVAWGAQHLVIKGDLVHKGDTGDWDLLARLLDHIPIPVTLVPGNHESRRGMSGTSEKILAGLGHSQDNPVHHAQVPGLRMIAFDSTVRDEHIGRVGHVHDALLSAAENPEPLLVLHHHNLQTTPFPTVYPRGAYGPEVRRMLKQISKRNPNVVFASGHTHRHRVRSAFGIPLLEVGSTKDYPGTWAGYAVHAGGIRQEVRRISQPDVLAWTEYTGQAVFGVWAHYAKGPRKQRCFNITWK